MVWVFVLLAALIAHVTTRLSIALSLGYKVLDVPNPRSSHVAPIPRIGGIGIVCGFYLPLLLFWALGHLGLLAYAPGTREFMLVVLVGGVMAATGLADDLRGIKPAVKLVVQLALAMVVAGFGIYADRLAIPLSKPVELGLWAHPLTVLWLVGFSNVYNFMDGINGLAGGTAVVYGLGFFGLASLHGNHEVAAVAVVLAGSSCGFLLHNFPVARTFMGDTGSLFLGMVFGVIAVQLTQGLGSPVPVIALLLVCSVFLYDSGFTLVRRMTRRENIFRAHRTHLYQRLVRTGLSHGKVTVLYLLLHLVVGLMGLAYVRVSEAGRVGLLLGAFALFVALTYGVHWCENRVAGS